MKKSCYSYGKLEIYLNLFGLGTSTFVVKICDFNIRGLSRKKT